MVAIVKKFSYTGTVQEVEVPAGTQSIDVYLWGGAGGGGGNDRHAGGSGAAGHFLKHTGFSITTVMIGQQMQVAVGGGGAGGSAGGGAPGGTNGKSLTDYSGGKGGNSGPTPNSGAGGGAGGATLIRINGTAHHIAGGGGGAGGGGNHSGGASGINTTSATPTTPTTLGENGGGHSGDGGGGGAGGGGFNGGKGGAGAGGDNGGGGGYSGLNLAQTGFTTSDVGSGTAPGGTGESYYQAGVAVGAGNSATGGNGYAVVVFNIGVQANIKVGGIWKKVNDMYTKVSGAWKQVTAGYIKVGGDWKALFNSGLNFIENGAGFGNPTGNSGAASGSGGGGGCFIAGTLVTMADGSQKAVELVDIRDEVAVGGFVFATGKFLIDDLFEYKGIKVSGTHMVKEEGSWTRVADSKYGKSLGDDEHIVYVFGSEFRRIMINGIEFTDYFEIDEKQKLLSIGEKFFGIWREHDRQTQVDDVKILNND